MASDWFTVFDGPSIAPSDWTGESQPSRDHFSGKVPLSNKMRDNVDLVGFNHPQHFAQAGFFFAEPANHVNKDPLLSDSVDVIPGRFTRIRVERGRVQPEPGYYLTELIRYLR